MNANLSVASKLTVGEWLALNTKRLESAGIRSARLDCFILLEQRVSHGRASILAHLNDVLTDEVLVKLNNDISLRLQHKPVSYITGVKEFYGRQFIVSEHVLVPRPESESIITLLKTLPVAGTIIDVGCGSGCLAITAKLENPESRVLGIDIDAKCLTVASQNAQDLQADVTFVKSDLLANFSTNKYPTPIYIVANLPYVPNLMKVNKPAKHEPSLALYGGPDGLDLYRCLFKQLDTLPLKPLAIITESLTTQHHTVAKLARDYNYILHKSDGLAQLFYRKN